LGFADLAALSALVRNPKNRGALLRPLVGRGIPQSPQERCGRRGQSAREAGQLEKQSRIESLVAVLAVVAARLLNLKLLARPSKDNGPIVICCEPSHGSEDSSVGAVMVSRGGKTSGGVGNGSCGWPKELN